MSAPDASAGNRDVGRRGKAVFDGLRGRTARRSPEAVARHQRLRLIGATLEACRRHGWASTTVDELVALAGVSKTSFYEQFASREECFLATFDVVIEAASAEIGVAYRDATGPRARLTAAMEAFAEIVARQPEAARLVVVDSLSLGVAAIPHRDAAAARFETMLRQSFDELGPPGAVGDLTIRALVGGIRRVLYRALRAGDPTQMRRHVDELVAWAMLYGEGVGSVAGSFEPPLDRGSAAVTQPDAWGDELSPDQAADEVAWEEPPSSDTARKALSQRERIVRATAIVATERGYGNATIGEICSTAGVSKETFYVHFSGKQDAFLTAYEALADRALAAAAAAFAAQPEWALGVASGLAALLRHIAANRLYAQLSFFELPTAGPEALDRVDTALESFTAFLHPAAFGASTRRTPSPIVIEAIGGGIWAAIQHEIAAGRRAELPELLSELSAIVLRPFAAVPTHTAISTS